MTNAVIVAAARTPIGRAHKGSLVDVDAFALTSGCSVGHPIAATGARMVVTMLGELARRDAALGCVAMCAGGGMGSGLVLERP